MRYKILGVNGYTSISPRIKVSANRQVSNLYSPTISYRRPLPCIKKQLTIITL